MSEKSVDAIILEYLQMKTSGTAPSQDDLLKTHPEIAQDLRSFFEEDATMRRLVGSIRTIPPPACSPDMEDETLAPEQIISREKRTSTTGMFAEYELLSKLGEGGMGTVYKARHCKLKRIVALKMILSGKYAQESELERFRIEAEAVARLQHPGIVQIFEVGQQDGQSFIALEFCDGGSLETKLREGLPSIREAASMVQQLAEGVEAAHQQRVIHRDLKPANVLLTEGGQLKITDFGLAKKLDESEGLTQQNAIMGTPSYMAPEQAGREKQEVGTAADVYALGAILYECLTGRPPYREATFMDTVLAVLDQEPIPPHRFNSKVPRDLETIALKCLEKDPNRRYVSAQDVADELNRYRNGEPIQARSIGRLERGWRWCKRNPVVAGMSAAVILLLVAGTAVSSFFAIQAGINADNEAAARKVAETKEKQAKRLAESEEKARKEADLKKKEAEDLAERMKKLADSEKKAREQIEVSEKETRWHLYVAKLFPMIQAWKERNFGQLHQLLSKSIPEKGEQDFRSWEWYYLKDQVDQASRLLRGRTPYGGFASWCQKTGRIAIARRGAIDIWDSSGQKVEQTVNLGKSWILRVAFSPDGNSLACALDGKLLIILNLPTNKVVHRWTINDRGGWGDLKWNPDGNLIAFAGKDGLIKIWTVRTGQILKTLTANRGRYVASVNGVDWHPDGKHLATASRHSTCNIWNIETGKLVRSIVQKDINGTVLQAVSWSSDGKKLAIGHLNGVTIQNEQGQKVASIDASLDGRTSLQWSPDNVFLLYGGGHSHTVGIWNSASQEKRVFQLHASGIVTVAWSPDGKRALAVSNTGPLGEARIFEAGKPDSKVILKQISQSSISKIDWSSDGSTIVCALPEGTAICPVNTGKTGSLLPGRRVVSVGWCPDRKIGGSVELSRRVIVWDATSRKQTILTRLSYAGTNPTDLVWSPNRKWLAVTGSMIKLWGTASWNELEPLGEDQAIRCAAWSPNSRYLATGRWSTSTGPAGLTVWDISKQRKHFHKQTGAVCYSTGWSPDGKVVAAGSSQGWIQFYRSQDGKLVHTAQGHKGRVSSICWSPDGRRIASGGWDQTLKIWDASTGLNLITLQCDSPVNDLAWSPDGRRIACACEDGTLRIWGSSEFEVTPKTATLLETGLFASVKTAEQESAEKEASLAAAIKTEPDNHKAWQDRALFRMRHQKWKEAQKDWEQAIQLGGGWWHHHKAAYCSAMVGDHKAHRMHCERIIQSYEKMDKSWARSGTARPCSLLPHSGLNYEVFLNGAQELAKEIPNEWWTNHSPAPVLYRMGRYQEALRVLLSCEKMLKTHHHLTVHRTVHLLWKALIYQRLSQKKQAKKLLSEAIELSARWMPEPNDKVEKEWMINELVECATLRREAEALIGKIKKPVAPTLIEPKKDAVMDNGRTDRTDLIDWHFRWEPVEDATDYELIVEHPRYSRRYLEVKVPSPSFRYLKSMYLSSTYKDGWTWQVRAIVYGRPGPWSAPQSFSLEPVNTDPKGDPVANLQKVIQHYQDLTKKMPKVSLYQSNLVSSHRQLADYHWRTTRDIDKAETAYRQTIKAQEKLIELAPKEPTHRYMAGYLLNNLSSIVRSKKLTDKAREALEQAIVHQREAVKLSPDNRTYQSSLERSRYSLISLAMSTNNHSEAVKQIMEMGQTTPKGTYSYSSAYSLMRCLPLVDKDEKLTPEQRKAAKEDYSKKAVGLLKQALENGSRYPASSLMRNAIFAPLRERKDFQELLKQFEKN